MIEVEEKNMYTGGIYRIADEKKILITVIVTSSEYLSMKMVISNIGAC